MHELLGFEFILNILVYHELIKIKKRANYVFIYLAFLIIKIKSIGRRSIYFHSKISRFLF